MSDVVSSQSENHAPTRGLHAIKWPVRSIVAWRRRGTRNAKHSSMAKQREFSQGRISQLILATILLLAPSSPAALHLSDPIAVDPPRLTTNTGIRFSAKLATGLKTT